MSNIIQISNLYVYYGQFCALENINLQIEEKEFLAIIGPNGGGKSTLLKTILGLITSFEGKVEIYGQPAKKALASIGYVPQASTFDIKFPINVIDAILMGRLPEKMTPFHKYSKEDMSQVKNIMDKLEIAHLKNRQIGQLSIGQLQRILIARALVKNPKILLLDEPTASLDACSKTQIFELLKELNKNITIIVVSHDLGAISSYVNKIACLNKKLHYHGAAELDNSLIEEVYGCPIDLIAHGVPHRVLGTHKEDSHD